MKDDFFIDVFFMRIDFEFEGSQKEEVCKMAVLFIFLGLNFVAIGECFFIQESTFF